MMVISPFEGLSIKQFALLTPNLDIVFGLSCKFHLRILNRKSFGSLGIIQI